MGPFELMDLIGNDINFAVTSSVWKAFFHDQRYTPSLTQQRQVESGRLGRKTGQGYYAYGEGAQTPVVADIPKELAEAITVRVLAMLINEAADALFLRVASATDIDVAITKGVNYPRGRWHGVLTPLGEPKDFLVVDRGGDGSNIEEFFFDEPWEVRLP